MYTSDPKSYSEASKPHESVQAAEKAVQDFMDEVGKLRKQYRLPEVVFAVSANALDADGDTIPVIMTFSFGSMFEAEALYAHGLGTARANRTAAIGKILRA